jgi:hypothetical protein
MTCCGEIKCGNKPVDDSIARTNPQTHMQTTHTHTHTHTVPRPLGLVPAASKSTVQRSSVGRPVAFARMGRDNRRQVLTQPQQQQRQQPTTSVSHWCGCGVMGICPWCASLWVR